MLPLSIILIMIAPSDVASGIAIITTFPFAFRNRHSLTQNIKVIPAAEELCYNSRRWNV